MRKFAIVFFIAVLIGLDAVSKWFFDASNWREYFPILGDWLGIQLSYNHGVAFSLPIHGFPLKVLTTLLVGAMIIYYIRSEYTKNHRWVDIAFSLIIAGALSHWYERIFIGYVVDFIAVKYFAILNFADIFISIGACILFLFSFFHRKTEYV